MILINNKDFETLCNDTSKKLSENGFATTPGAIAKLFADILNKNISDFYGSLGLNHVQAFVTTAKGDFLDAIGVLLNCSRKNNENDEDYRSRITHQCLSLAMANETSIRLAVLSVPGVDDVILKRYSHGPGSFTIIPLINSSYNSNTIKSLVNDAVASVCSYGEKITIKLPSLKYIKLIISLAYSTNVTDVEKQNVAVNVREEIIKYINSLTTGETFIINELTQRIMNVQGNSASGSNSTKYDYKKDEIINYSCTSFKINNQISLLINQGARWDEKFAVSPDADAIVVA